MPDSLAESLLAELSEFVAMHLGLHFPPARRRDLARGMAAITRELAFQNAAACIQWLMASPWTQKKMALLGCYLTVGETYFFREQNTLQVLQEHLLPTLLHSRRSTTRRLQIWSAGCATGEEAYSIAMLLHQLLPDFNHWQVTLLATDVNPRSLEKAAAGVYGAWSFRNTPPWIRDRYFNKRERGRYEILPVIKNMVTFVSLNLVTAPYPSPQHNLDAMDVIFCRNVLMYFATAQATRVVHRLYHTLAPGGWLVVSPSETSHTLFAEFMPVHFPGVTLYQKDDGSSRPSAGILPTVRPLAAPYPATPLPLPLAAAVAHAPLPRDARPPSATQTAGGAAVPAPPRPARLDPSREALVLYAQGRYAETVGTLVGLCAHQPAPAADMALLARAYANQGQLEAARQWVENAIAADKVKASWHYLHATILQEQGDLTAAVASLKRVLYLDQHLVLAHVALGSLTRRQQKYQEAAKHFENARLLLRAYQPDDVLPEAEGLTAGRLMAVIGATTSGETLA